VGIDEGGYRFRIVDMGVDIRLGVEFEQGLKHLLAPPHVDKPVMDNGDVHDKYVSVEAFPKPQFWESNLIKSTFVRPIGLKKHRSLAQSHAL
jgi:hypothetical protein